MTRPDGVRRLFRLADSTRSAARDVDDELRFHLETRVAELVARGVPRDEAEREAAREFGDVGAARAELAAMDRARLRHGARADWWSGWRQDLRYAVRALTRQPGFTATVLLTIALSVGANGAIFSALDAALLRPLPYREPDRLVALWQTSATTRTDKSNTTYPNLLDWRRESTSFVGIAGYHSNRMVLSRDERPRVVWTGKTSANFFEVLGVRPAVGRLFAEGEDAVGAPRVVVLAHDLWRREFDADPRIVGRSVRLDGASYTVVGVLPADFQFSRVGAAEVWVPFDRGASMRENRGGGWFDSIARLKPGVTIERAGEEMRAIAASLAHRYPDPDADVSVLVTPLRDELTGNVRPMLLVLFGAAGLVLLVALANVASLLLVRGASRARELAVRASLGAGRGRIVRQLLTESLLLSLVGGVLALVVANASVRALVAAIPPQRLLTMPYLAHVGLDARLVAYMLALSIVAGACFGVLPALRAARPRLGELLRQGARGSSVGGGVGRTRDALVVGELALTVILVSGAALFGRSLARLLAVDPGFRADRVLTAFIPLPRVEYAKPDRQRAFFLSLEERLRALPGVATVGLTSKLPLDPGNATSYRVEGEPEPAPGHAKETLFRVVTPSYFRTLGIQLVRGTVFDAGLDSLRPRELMVSERFVREAFDDRDAVGRRLIIGSNTWTVVGIVRDVAVTRLDEPLRGAIYLPFARARPRWRCASRCARTATWRGSRRRCAASCTTSIRRSRCTRSSRWRAWCASPSRCSCAAIRSSS
ncbi:permease [Gemmatirosa kalamazoonensis]|uniref:Permease n=1 Tax=Gemmatirosa kalamazoonensis TaxID=861299 RepID=W0RLI6_9BACT|nr:ADOP family duplicated permease [Gemmatirosa kalamazoonensis]AHG91636.1 permease [Gemmatirosa kalamazoonensis]